MKAHASPSRPPLSSQRTGRSSTPSPTSTTPSAQSLPISSPPSRPPKHRFLHPRVGNAAPTSAVLSVGHATEFCAPQASVAGCARCGPPSLAEVGWVCGKRRLCLCAGLALPVAWFVGGSCWNALPGRGEMSFARCSADAGWACGPPCCVLGLRSRAAVLWQ
ncbi:unnamed protein product [Chondrus crispus]|uniref:Uncharacterized protein n=1 Tax=Chondrus crispus TaxID=2769 RepID=R7Q5Z7_CHOCR|nr:unnamed protein product [Chondrus crispus]XP_005712612.1 unnamed protein product [Chondrus crispus]CDF32809.1 unnamed protein product [Chondrus crispus]CDF32811.1 unnamed protein product [Chondrus crispus]|eukprot:XP_005712610.1 unnamed protein product [Chondrus crispus]